MLPWAHPRPHPKQYLDRFSRFAQLTAEDPYTLQRADPLTVKLPLNMEDLDPPPSYTWFLWLTRVHNPNGISISSAVFAVLTIVTDRLTNRQTDHVILSVTIRRIPSTAMWPNKRTQRNKRYRNAAS